MFENVVGVLDQIDTAKLNSVLSALAQGVRGKGERIGQATTDANQVFLALNPRSETVRADWQALKGFSDTYSVAAQDILTILNAASTTSVTITNRAQALDALLLATIGFSNSGINLLAPNQANLIKAINVLEPTTNLLMKYNPEYTCLLVGAKTLLDKGGYEAPGGNGYRSSSTPACLCFCCHLFSSVTTRTAIRDNLPIIGAKGGPGGKPGCGSLPLVDDNWPVRQLITNTGFGTGVDWRPNPGIGFPGYGQLPAGHPRGARAAEHPQPVRRARAGTDSLPGCPALWRADVRAGRHPVVAGAAARTAAGGAEGSGPAAGFGTVRGARARTTGTHSVTADSNPAGGDASTLTARH